MTWANEDKDARERARETFARQRAEVERLTAKTREWEEKHGGRLTISPREWADGIIDNGEVL